MKLFILSSIIGLMSCSVYVKPVPAHAEVYVEKPAVTTTLYVSSAPPPPRVEYQPAPRVGYVWVSGYWHWSGGSWVWHQGHWEAERVGYIWVAPRYEVHQGKYVYTKGSWAPSKGYKTANPTGYKASHGKNANGYKTSAKEPKSYKADNDKKSKHSKKSKRS